jgi:hypothetical protein
MGFGRRSTLCSKYIYIYHGERADLRRYEYNADRNVSSIYEGMPD